MRGSPPVQLAFLLLGFFVVGVPLVQLTQGRTQTTALERQTLVHDEACTVFLRVRYAHKPSKLVVKSGEVDMLAQADPGVSPVEGRSTMIVAPEGLELSVMAEWPAGTPETALTVEVEPDAMDGRSKTFWSIDGRIADIAAFTWK